MPAPRQRTRQLRDEGMAAVVMNQHVHSILRCAMSRKHNRASAKVWHHRRAPPFAIRPFLVILSTAKNLALQQPATPGSFGQCPHDNEKPLSF